LPLFREILQLAAHMKKPNQIGDDVSGDEAKWEHARRVIATASTLAEASNLLEEETSFMYRRGRRHDDSSRPKREKGAAEKDSENLSND
jgi:hypothetical protein